MAIRFEHAVKRNAASAFSLVEVLVSFTIVLLVMAGAIYSYLMSNRMAEWSSMSLAAQSYAEQGIERARAAQWNSEIYPPTNGPGTSDQLAPRGVATNVFWEMDTNCIPSSGAPIYATNFVYLSIATNTSPSALNPTNPSLRQIRSDVVWTFPLTQKIFTNTVITLRAPDQ